MTNANGRESSSTEDLIGETLMTCVFHWRMRDVPDARIEEMEEELGDHLREAVENGRSVESVVGDDTVAFAEEWAKEARSERSFLGWALEIGWALVFGVVFTATVYHLFTRSLTFEVEASLSLPVVLILWSVVVFRTGGAASYDPGNPWWVAWVRAFILLPVFLGPFFISWVVTGERDAVLFEWHWLYTLTALVAAVVLDRLAKKSVGQK